MADAPRPITSPPAQPWQPYSATEPGAAEDQVTATTIYDAAGGPGAGNPWVKIQDGGASNSSGEASADSWPGDGDSDGSAWKQV